MRVPWLGLAFVAGCSPFAVSERDLGPDAPEGTGALVLRAVEGSRDEKLAPGYSFSVSGGGLAPTSFASRSDRPTVLDELVPGRYDVRVTGEHLGTARVKANVRPGVETTLTFSARTARQANAVEEFAAVTGKAVFYAGFGLFYLIGRACVTASCGGTSEGRTVDDGGPRSQGCSGCGYASCRCSRSSSRSSTPSPRDEPKPRVRDILK